MPLNEEQQFIIVDPHENKLICSLPGSGKTTVIIALADKILDDPNASVLMVTFTNASATEMHERALNVLGREKAKRLKAKTFAKVMLEQHKPLLDGRRLILGAELDSYILRVANKLKIDHATHFD